MSLLSLSDSDSLGETRYVKKGTVIAKQGMPVELAYIIARGQVLPSVPLAGAFQTRDRSQKK